MKRTIFLTAAFVLVGVSACAPSTHSSLPTPTLLSSSALRVVQGNHVTLFSGSATWSRTAEGIVVAVNGRTVTFSGVTSAQRIRNFKPPGGRNTMSLVSPVQCATCEDGGKPQIPGHGSVHGVTASASGVDIIFDTSGGDVVRVDAVDANGNVYETWYFATDFAAGLVAELSLDASMFGGSVPEHGRVTVIGGGGVTGNGGW